jgi:hypothetical protein
MTSARVLLALLFTSFPLTAVAQSGDGGGSTLSSGSGDSASSSTSSSVSTVDSGHTLTDEQADLEEDAPPATPALDTTNPRELEDHDYFFVGGLFRTLFIPDWVQGLFVSYEGGTAVNFGGGAYFGWRRNGFNVVAEVWYGGFHHTGFYHGANASDDEFEHVNTQLGVVFGSFLFGWTIPITEWLGFDIGFGLGIGGMTGSLTRTEAYRVGGSTGDLEPCDGPGMPSTGAYCNPDVELRGADGRVAVMGGTYQNRPDLIPPGSTYTNTTNPFYFGDGGVPPLFFWLDLPRLGFVIRPVRQLQIVINGGYNLYGFNVGATIGYGFD